MDYERRTITQTIKVPTNTGRTVDEHVQVYLNKAANVMDQMGIGIWPAIVSDPATGDAGDAALAEILAGAKAMVETDEKGPGAPYLRFAPVAETDIRDRLIAWRDAAVRAALDAEFAARRA